MKQGILFLVLGLSLGLVGCKKDAKDAAAAAGSDTGLTTSQLAGNYQSTCQTAGAPSGKSYKYYYSFYANGIYNFSMDIVDSASCAMGAGQLIRFYQTGTFSITGASSSVTNGYKLQFNIGSSHISAPVQTPTDITTYRDYFNNTANCGSPTLNLVGSSNNTASLSGRTCTGYSAAFPVDTSVNYNVVTMSSTTIFQVNMGSLLWYPGLTVGSGYPTSVNMTFTKY